MFKNMPETKGDSIMKREIFNNYTDQLCKDGLISNYQYDSWTNPFQISAFYRKLINSIK